MNSGWFLQLQFEGGLSGNTLCRISLADQCIPWTFLKRLWLQFSHLNEHKFCHNFKDCLSPICDCGAETETTNHFFLCCPFFANERQKLRDDVYRLDASIKHLNKESLIDDLLHGSDRFNGSKNKQILLHNICYIQATKHFERPLIDQC